jgi:hypothetical protein
MSYQRNPTAVETDTIAGKHTNGTVTREIKLNATSGKYYQNGELINTMVDYPPNADLGVYLVETTGTGLAIHYVFVTNYTANEPQHGDAYLPAPPIQHNVVIAFVNGSADGNLNNYVVYYNVYISMGYNNSSDGNLFLNDTAADGSNLRFRNANDTKIVYKHNVTEMGNSTCLRVAVNLTNLTTASGLWVAATCDGTTDTNDMDGTFIVCDNFNAATVDTDRWTVSGTVALSDGKANFNSGGMLTSVNVGWPCQILINSTVGGTDTENRMGLYSTVSNYAYYRDLSASLLTYQRNLTDVDIDTIAAGHHVNGTSSRTIKLDASGGLFYQNATLLNTMINYPPATGLKAYLNEISGGGLY